MNFERIADKYPSERHALDGLKQLLEQDKGVPREFTLTFLCEQDKGVPREFTLTFLCEQLHPHSREGLALVLAELVCTGELKQVVRVISPSTQGGIGDFRCLEEVPNVLHDWRADLQIEVRPEDLRVIYITEPVPKP